MVVVPTIERHAVSGQGRTCGAARHLRSLTPGRLRGHGPVPVYRVQKNSTQDSRLNTARVNLDAAGVTDGSEHMSTEHRERSAIRIPRCHLHVEDVKSPRLRKLTHDVVARVKPSIREKYGEIS